MTTTVEAVPRREFIAFGGARCELICPDAGSADLAAAEAEVRAFERALTRFDASSELSRFNAAAGARVAVSPLLEEMLRVCLDAAALSAGLVNAAVHDAVVAAGYDATIGVVRARPGTAPLRTTVSIPPLADIIDVGAGWARCAPGWRIDLGGVGKGWLADRLGDRFDNCVINLGGDVRVRGEGMVGTGWTVTLCDGTTVDVRNAGIATSGVTGRAWRGGHHLIDPRTGRPCGTAVAALSVVAVDTLTAEIFAKAALITGRPDFPRLLDRADVLHWTASGGDA